MLSIFRRWKTFKLFESLVFVFLVFIFVSLIQNYLVTEANIARFIELREKNIETLELFINNLLANEFSDELSTTVKVIEANKRGTLKLLHINSGNIDAKTILFDDSETFTASQIWTDSRFLWNLLKCDLYHF